MLSTSPCRTRESRGRSRFGRGLGVPCLYQHVPVQNAGVQRAQPLWQSGTGTSPCRTRESRGARALWQGSGVSPYLLRTPPVLKAGVQRAPPLWQGSGSARPISCKRGSPEGAALWQGSGGVPQPFFVLPQSSKRESRGRSPLAGVWGVPQLFFVLPVLKAGVQRGAALWQGSGGVPQPFRTSSSPQSGNPEGRRPLAGVWDCPCPIFVLSTVLKAGVQRAPPFGRGLGVSPNPSSYVRGPQSGSPEGAQPLWQGSGGVPQRFNFLPLPSRKGVRGMVRATSETTLPRSGRTARRRRPRLLRCTRNDERGCGTRDACGHLPPLHSLAYNPSQWWV